MNRREFTRNLSYLLATAGFDWSVRHGNAAARSEDEVLNGIDVLAKQNFRPVQGLRLGLITNHTGHDRRRRPTIDLLKSAPGVKLVALFSPEHGIRGEADEKIGDTTDAKTGLPIYSLYGERRAPSSAQLRELDALVFDIQDIGCRFYTYISTLGLCLEAAAQAKLKFFVLDRLNPINGVDMEGPVNPARSSFTAYHPIPLRHGLTVGELARLYDAERGLNSDLTIIPIQGWQRADWFDDTGLPWTNPSPNMRSLPAAILYPGIGLHETALSVGRGTDKPFEVIGAPYIDDVKLARELVEARIPGMRFVPIRFTPGYSTFKDRPCGGVALIITDRAKLNAVDLGLTVALMLHRLYPAEFALSKVNTLLQHPATINAMRAGESLSQIKRRWEKELRDFKARRKPFLLYA